MHQRVGASHASHFAFCLNMLENPRKMACEEERTRLIGQIVSLLREGSVPEDAHKAGLTLIGWLARRMPGEPVSLAGVEEMLKRCKEAGFAAGDSSPVQALAAEQSGQTALATNHHDAEPMADKDNPRLGPVTRGSRSRRR